MSLLVCVVENSWKWCPVFPLTGRSYSLIGRSRTLVGGWHCWTRAKARPKKGPDESQVAVEEERINEYKLQRGALPTAIPRAGVVHGAVPLHQRQPGAYSAQGTGGPQDKNEVSHDEFETEYQEAMALPTIAKQRRAGKPQSSGYHKAELDKLKQKLPCFRWRHIGHWKDGHRCLAKVKRVNWAGGSSKLVGELGTVDCVSGSRNLVSLKAVCDSNESL